MEFNKINKHLEDILTAINNIEASTLGLEPKNYDNYEISWLVERGIEIIAEALSDVDFLYKFRKEDIEETDYADNYFDLLFELQDLLNKKVDLVAEEKMWNPYFIESINESKQIIYES